MKSRIQLSDHFTFGKLLRFTLPSMGMMIFTSIYGVVDGFFVSNYVGKTPFAAVNFIYPVIIILSAVGTMFGTGGNAVVAVVLGQGDRERADRLFSLFVYVSLAVSGVIAVLGQLLLRPIAVLLGAEGEMLEYCVLYARIILGALPFLMLQMEFQSTFVTAEKPKLGFYVTVAAGVTNMVLDALFMAVFHWGVAGAAVATALSQVAGGLPGLIYFMAPNSSLLRLTKTRFDGKALARACLNGSAGMVSTLAMSTISMLYNFQLIKYAGEDGVAAYGVLMYVSMIFSAVFMGYSMGFSPVMGFHYGAAHHDEMRGLLRKSLVIIGVFSLCMFALAEVLASPLSTLYVGYDLKLFALTQRGFLIYSFSYLFSGLAIYGSSFFTALNNGVIAALLSFLRTLVFQVAAVLLLPLLWGIDGVWISIVVAEGAAAALTALFMVAMRKKYHY